MRANDIIKTMTSDPAGNIYVAGHFSNSNSPASGKRYVAKWNGSVWSELGGLNALSANAPILAVASDLQGNIYAGGAFTNASGKTYVAKWTASTNTWSELGGLNALNANASILSITTDAAGNVYAAGNFQT